jgi:hypothetical protein
MPRKNPTQKQKQKQSVKQSVVVKIGADVVKKRKRTRRGKTTRGGSSGQFLTQPPLGANVIYQSNQLTPVPFAQETAPKITDAEPKKPTLLEDTGIVGTEGKGVRILELPTKKEQLESMTAPVSKKMAETIPPRFEQKTPSLTTGLDSELPKFSRTPDSEAPLNKMNEPLNKGLLIPPLSEAIEVPISKEREDDAISAQAEKMAKFAPERPRRIRKPRTEEQKERDRQKAREYRARMKAGNTGRLQG